MNSFTITAKEKSKWYDLRYKLASWLVNVARRIYPKHPETTAFLMQQIVDMTIYGKGMVRINPEERESK